MYAGIVTLISEKEGADDVVKGMCSKEGETVAYKNFVKIVEDPRINVWLGKVDNEMMNSLAVELEQSVKDINDKSLSQMQTIEVHPAQIILLALQVNWCFLVE
jgi:dynein heavy chain 1